MRILVVGHYAIKGSYGIYDYNLCKFLEKEGVNVNYIALFGDCSEYCKNAKIVKKFFWFLPQYVSNRISEVFSIDIISEIQRNYDVIHVQAAYWSFIPLQILIWKKILRIKTPVVMTTHAFEPELQNRFWTGVKKTITQKNLSFLFYGIRCIPYRMMNMIFCQTQSEKQFVVNQFEINDERVVVIPNCVDIDRFKIIATDIKNKYKIKNFMIFYAGQLIDIKGINYLLESIKILKDRGFDCDLILCSYNPKEDLLTYAKMLMIDKNVVIIKKPLEEELISAYMSCDVFVLPSLQESFPTVLLEAMAAKKPVIATNVGGIPDFIKDGHNGLLVEPREPDAIANRIIELLKNNNMYAKISENGYQTILKNFRWDEIIKIIIKQYEILKNR